MELVKTAKWQCVLHQSEAILELNMWFIMDLLDVYSKKQNKQKTHDLTFSLKAHNQCWATDGECKAYV